MKPRLSPGNVVLLKSIDLAKLALFEQARDLSIKLLTDWLVEYKFKDWTEHRTSNKGKSVTKDQKRKRAEDIATDLANHKKWLSHGRSLDVKKLKSLRIEIEDYTDNKNLGKYILPKLIVEYPSPTFHKKCSIFPNPCPNSH